MISKEYKALLKQTHEQDDDWGSSAGFWLDDIKAAMGDSKSVLDYGCGKAVLSELLDFDVYNYDPALDIDERKECDFLVCVDVLEHVEDEYLHDVLQDMVQYPQKGYFIAIHTKEAQKKLIDGRNAHINIKSHDEWIEILKPYFGGQFKKKGRYVLIAHG